MTGKLNAVNCMVWGRLVEIVDYAGYLLSSKTLSQRVRERDKLRTFVIITLSPFGWTKKNAQKKRFRIENKID